MEFDVLRALVLVTMLAIPAAHDIFSRTVPRDVLVLCGVVSACFFAYGLLSDITSGTGYGTAQYVFAVLGVIFGVMVARLGIMGAADGYVIAAASVMMPYCNEVPVALAGAVVGLVCMSVFVLSQNILYNILDIRHGRPYCTGAMFALRHIKRAGERFAVSSLGLRKAAAAYDGTVKDSSGRDYFVPVNAKGMPVHSAMPAVAFIAAGLAAVCAFVLM